MRTKEKEGWRETHVAHSLGKLLTSFVLQPSASPSRLCCSTSLSLRARVSLFKSRNVRLTTQWKQQLHDRWSRPTDSIQRPLFLRSPPLLLLLRTGRYRRVYSRKQPGGEERLSMRCWLLDVDRVHVVEKKLMIVNIFLFFFFCPPLHLKHFFSFSFLFLVITASHLITRLSPLKTHDSKLFLPFTFLITDLYNCSSINLRLEFNGWDN